MKCRVLILVISVLFLNSCKEAAEKAKSASEEQQAAKEAPKSTKELIIEQIFCGLPDVMHDIKWRVQNIGEITLYHAVLNSADTVFLIKAENAHSQETKDSTLQNVYGIKDWTDSVRNKEKFNCTQKFYRFFCDVGEDINDDKNLVFIYGKLNYRYRYLKMDKNEYDLYEKNRGEIISKGLNEFSDLDRPQLA